MMTMGQVQALAVHQKLGEIRQTGEGEDHLVHLRFAVAPDGDDFLLPGGEHGNDLLGGIIPGQVIPGTVIQQIPQQHQLVRLIVFRQGHEFFAPVGASVNIGCNKQFHKDTPNVSR